MNQATTTIDDAGKQAARESGAVDRAVAAAKTAADALTPEEDEFIELINQERSNRGLNPLTEYWDLTDDARAWSDQMDADGVPSHNPDLASITSNESDDWLGDGSSVDDIQVDSHGRIRLRAERSGRGTGRIYTLNFSVTDASGNQSSTSATVVVPHDRGKKK